MPLFPRGFLEEPKGALLKGGSFRVCGGPKEGYPYRGASWRAYSSKRLGIAVLVWWSLKRHAKIWICYLRKRKCLIPANHNSKHSEPLNRPAHLNSLWKELNCSARHSLLIEIVVSYYFCKDLVTTPVETGTSRNFPRVSTNATVYQIASPLKGTGTFVSSHMIYLSWSPFFAINLIDLWSFCDFMGKGFLTTTGITILIHQTLLKFKYETFISHERLRKTHHKKIRHYFIFKERNAVIAWRCRVSSCLGVKACYLEPVHVMVCLKTHFFFVGCDCQRLITRYIYG